MLSSTHGFLLEVYLFLDAIASPSTYPVYQSVSGWVMFSDFGDGYHIYWACELVVHRAYSTQGERERVLIVKNWSKDNNIDWWFIFQSLVNCYIMSSKHKQTLLDRTPKSRPSGKKSKGESWFLKLPRNCLPHDTDWLTHDDDASLKANWLSFRQTAPFIIKIRNKKCPTPTVSLLVTLYVNLKNMPLQSLTSSEFQSFGVRRHLTFFSNYLS